MFIILRDDRLATEQYFKTKQEAFDKASEMLNVVYEYGVRYYKHLILSIKENDDSVYITCQKDISFYEYGENDDITEYCKYVIVELTENKTK